MQIVATRLIQIGAPTRFQERLLRVAVCGDGLLAPVAEPQVGGMLVEVIAEFQPGRVIRFDLNPKRDARKLDAAKKAAMRFRPTTRS
jgi:hypothetical protein